METTNKMLPTSGRCGEQLNWRLQADTLFIEGKGEMWARSMLPWNSWHGNLDPKLFSKLVIESGCTMISDRAFLEHPSLVEVSIPDTVHWIGPDSFSDCEWLKSITVHPSNPVYASENGLLIDKRTQTLQLCPAGQTGKVSIPCGIVKIGECSCSCDENITEVDIPLGVEIIMQEAFYGCDKLEKVHFPASLKEIDSEAFGRCPKLKTVVLPAGAVILDYAFEGCESLASVSLPSDMTRIFKSTFEACTSLREITIPDTVTIIDQWAFRDCTGFTSLVIPDSVTEIGKDAFKNVPHIIYHGSAHSEDNWGALSRN